MSILKKLIILSLILFVSCGEIPKKEIQRARKEKYRTGRVMVFKGTKKKIGKKSSKSKKNRRNTKKRVKKQISRDKINQKMLNNEYNNKIDNPSKFTKWLFT